MALDTFWSQWLNETPDILYAAMRPQTGTRSFMDYWRGQQGNVYSDYLGRLGGMALGGQNPTLNYSDYLQDYPFLSKWSGMSPGERGEQPQRFAPRVRWNL